MNCSRKFEFTIILILNSYATLASITVPYLPSMLLGRTFDYSTSEVGHDIYDKNARNNAKVTRQDKSDINYRIIKSNKDIRDVLDVSGQLSLKAMAGMIDLHGRGSYLKSSIESGNSVEVLVQINYRTATKTILDTINPIQNWDEKPIIGQHYIRSLTYGGYLIASLKFYASKQNTKEEIEAKLTAGMNAGALKVGVKGQFAQVAHAAKDFSKMIITYSSSTVPDIVPVNLTTLLYLVDNFPREFKKLNNKNNLPPIEAEIRELSYLKPTNEKLKFIKNELADECMDRLADMYYDLKVTADYIKKSIKDANLTRQEEAEYGSFNAKVWSIKHNFTDTIQNLNLNGSKDQFKTAYNAYKEGKLDFLPGKFLREIKRINKESPSISQYHQKQAEIEEEIRRMNNTVTDLKEDFSSLEGLVSGLGVLENFK